MTELVTIITPTYNSENFISQTMDSVAAQNYQNWEHIIIDDGSDDKTVELVLDRAKNDHRIKLIRQFSHQGPACTRNKGIAEAKGRYIAFLDSDDIWHPEKLEKQLRFMSENKAILSYTAYKKMDEDGIVANGVVTIPEKVSYEELLNSCVIGCLTAVYDTQPFGKMYMPLIDKRQDYGLWLSILKKGCQAFGLNEPLAFYRMRRNSVSSNKLLAAKYQWKIYREVEKLSWFKSAYHFLFYAYYGYKKYKV